MVELIKPMFPLEQYPFPVRKMAVKSMKPDQIIMYSLSSPAAARIVGEARIPLKLMFFMPSGPHSLKMRIKFGTWREYRFDFGKMKEQNSNTFSIRLISGETLQACGTSSRLRVITDETNTKKVLTLVLNHLTTVFASNGREEIIAHFKDGISLLDEFFSPANIRTVAKLELQGKWRPSAFEKFKSCFNVTDSMDVPSNRLREENLLGLETPEIDIPIGKPDHFKFIVNKWAAGEAFRNLEQLEFSSSTRFSEEKRYLEGIRSTHWDSSKRPRFLCSFKNIWVHLFKDLKDERDVYRTDGKIGTIFPGSFDSVIFRVWRGDESVEKNKETTKRMLENQEKEYNKRKEEMFELNKRMEEIEKKERMSELQKKNEKKTIKCEKMRLEIIMESIEEKMKKIREIIPHLV